MKIGVLALGRATFDIEFANQKLSECISFLKKTSYSIIGGDEILLESDATQNEAERLQNENVDFVVIIQITFTDALMTVQIANKFKDNFGIWAIPEPRLGERLRLNSFCGLNLASHALSLNNMLVNWIFEDPLIIQPSIFDAFVKKRLSKNKPKIVEYGVTSDRAKQIKNKIKEFKIAKIGEHPEGFDTCKYNKDDVKKLTGISIYEFTLNELFKEAKSIDKKEINNLHKQVKSQISSLDNVDPKELDLSLRLKSSLDKIRGKEKFNSFAIRCWPETFTEYGGAICAPVSMLSENKIPCACEADIYGSITQIVLQEVSGSQVFLTDLVDIDINDNTGVVWHCGQAPISMCDEEFKPQATIHTNRKMPLLFQFPLKRGVVTLMRISKSFGKQKMVISKGEMLKRDMAFTGTSGVIKFDKNAEDVLNDIINSGLEHHMALSYGDHTQLLKEVASTMELPVQEI